MDFVVTNVNVFTTRKKHCWPPFPTKTLCICFFYVLTSESIDAQTTIVICGRSDSVFVAADSKGTVDLQEMKSILTCKIIRYNDSLFIATSGHTGNVIRKEYIEETIASIGEVGARSLVDKADTIAERVLPLVFPAMVRANKSQLVARLIFIGREHGVLRVIAKEFLGIQNGPLVDFLRTRQIFKIDDSLKYYVSSDSLSYPAIISLAASGHFKSLSLVQQTLAITKTAIAIDTVNSAPPIDMVCLHKGGYFWVSRKPQCNE